MPPREIQQLEKIQRRSGLTGAGCDHLDYYSQVFLPVPATAESSAAFPSCVNLPSRSFLFALAEGFGEAIA